MVKWYFLIKNVCLFFQSKIGIGAFHLKKILGLIFQRNRDSLCLFIIICNICTNSSRRWWRLYIFLFEIIHDFFIFFVAFFRLYVNCFLWIVWVFHWIWYLFYFLKQNFWTIQYLSFSYWRRYSLYVIQISILVRIIFF